MLSKRIRIRKGKERTIEDVKSDLNDYDKAVAFLDSKTKPAEPKPTPQPVRKCLDCGEVFKKDAPANKRRCLKCAVIHVREQKKKARRPPSDKVVKVEPKKMTLEQEHREIKEPLVASTVLSKKEQKRLSKMSRQERHEEDERYIKPMVTRFCPESVTADKLYDVRLNPEYYIEINIVKKNRVVDAFYIDSEIKEFTFKKKKYAILEDNIYLLPTRSNVMMPTSYYREDDTKPKGFRQENKGITGKALSLLYMEQLYTSLLYSEDVKYNFFIVILSIAILICFAIGLYLLFFMFPDTIAETSGGGGSAVPISLIRFWWWH